MAANIQISRLNAIRLRNGLTSIDYDAVMPKPDLMRLNTQYQAGVYPIEYYPDWKQDEQLSLQFQTDIDLFSTTDTVFKYTRLYNYITGTYTNCTLTDITPVGWVGYYVYKVSVTPTATGYYYIDVDFLINYTNAGKVVSDVFYVNENLTDKKLIEFQFYNESNDFGYVFDGYYKAFYTSVYDDSEGEIENSIYKTDTGTEKLNSKYHGGLDIILCDINARYYSVIRQQLRCDTLLFNGIECVCEENPTRNKTEKTDLLDINFKLTYKGSDEYLILD